MRVKDYFNLLFVVCNLCVIVFLYVSLVRVAGLDGLPLFLSFGFVALFDVTLTAAFLRYNLFVGFLCVTGLRCIGLDKLDYGRHMDKKELALGSLLLASILLNILTVYGFVILRVHNSV